MVVDCETEVLNFLIKELREGVDFKKKYVPGYDSSSTSYTHPEGLIIIYYEDSYKSCAFEVDGYHVSVDWVKKIKSATEEYEKLIKKCIQDKYNLERKNHFCSLLNKIRN